jgi:hypothetical protein
MRSVPILAMVAVLAGCAVPAPQQWRADGPTCVAMFQEYDRRVRFSPMPRSFVPDGWSIPGSRRRARACAKRDA